MSVSTDSGRTKFYILLAPNLATQYYDFMCTASSLCFHSLEASVGENCGSCDVATKTLLSLTLALANFGSLQQHTKKKNRVSYTSFIE